MTFSQFAKRKRLQSGHTQQQCAEAIGLKSRSAYRHKEQGERKWTLDDIVNLAEFYCIAPSELMVEWEIMEAVAKIRRTI